MRRKVVNQTFCDFVKFALEERHAPLEAVAQALNVSYPTIWNIRNCNFDSNVYRVRADSVLKPLNEGKKPKTLKRNLVQRTADAIKFWWYYN